MWPVENGEAARPASSAGEYIPQVSAWVPALTICSALGLATLPLAVTNPGWTVSPLALSTNAIGGALCSTCWWPHSIRANSTSAGILLWLVPIAALALMLGWAHPLTQMSGFFTKAALMTFGGAYAVLPYVYRGAVTHYGWLTAGQMMDGLATGGIDPRTVDHDGDLCRVCRRLHQSGIGR